MAPIGTSKEIAMSDPTVIQHDEDAVEAAPALEPVVPADAENPMDEDSVPDEDQPNR